MKCDPGYCLYITILYPHIIRQFKTGWQDLNLHGRLWITRIRPLCIHLFADFSTSCYSRDGQIWTAIFLPSDDSAITELGDIPISYFAQISQTQTMASPSRYAVHPRRRPQILQHFRKIFWSTIETSGGCTFFVFGALGVWFFFRPAIILKIHYRVLPCRIM